MRFFRERYCVKLTRKPFISPRSFPGRITGRMPFFQAGKDQVFISRKQLDNNENSALSHGTWIAPTRGEQVYVPSG